MVVGQTKCSKKMSYNIKKNQQTSKDNLENLFKHVYQFYVGSIKFLLVKVGIKKNDFCEFFLIFNC